MSENVSAEKSAKVSAAGFGGKGVAVAIVVAAILTVGGLALWAFQLTSGMVNTNMRNLDSWGLYITMFMFLVGLSAGGLIISSAPRVFGMEGFGGVSKIAVWTSICCTVLAIVGIFCKRVQLLVGGFQIPNLDMPAVVSGPALTDAGAALQSAGGSMVYFPSMLEFGVVLGVFGLGALMLLLGLKFLPLKPTERSH